MESLTERQKELANKIMEGKAFRQIGEEMGLQETSIKNMAHMLYIQIGVKNKFELTQYLLHGGLEGIGDQVEVTTTNEDQEAILHSVMEHFDEIYSIVGPTIKKAMNREKLRRGE